MPDPQPQKAPGSDIAAQSAAAIAAPDFVTLNGLPAAFTLIGPEDGFERIALRPDVGDAEYLVSYDAATGALTLRNLTHDLTQSVDFAAAGPLAPGETRDAVFDQIGAAVTLNAAFDFDATLEHHDLNPIHLEFIDAFSVVSVEGDLSGRGDEIVFTSDLSVADISVVCGAFSASHVDFSAIEDFHDGVEFLIRLTDGANAFTISMHVVDQFERRDSVSIGLDRLGQSFVSAPVGAFDIQGGAARNQIGGSTLDDTLRGGGGNDEIYAGDGDDVVFGEDGYDRLYGGAGDDRLIGGAGEDLLETLEGFNHIDGGDGSDRYSTGRTTADVTVRLDRGTISSAVGSGTIVNVERISTNRGDDVVIGDAKNNKIFTHDGRDIVAGGDGDDDINGQFDDDKLFGGAGDDRLIGESGDDRLVGDGGDDVLNGGRDNDVLLGGDGDDELIGYFGEDKLYGGAGLDVLSGGNEADFLRGGDDADQLNGENGDDVLLGDGGDDVIDGDIDDDIEHRGDDVIRGGDGSDTLRGHGGDDALYGDAGGDLLLGGGGDDVMRGGADGDLLHGGVGDDVLIGDAGDDVITGSAGVDRIRGGAGADIFRFVAGADVDVILDFEDGVDRINFFSHGGVDGIDDLVVSALSGGLDTKIALAADPNGPEMIILRGVAIADIGASDFQF